MAVKVPSPNYWTIRELPKLLLLKSYLWEVDFRPAGPVILPRLSSGSGVGVEVGKPMGATPAWKEQGRWPLTRQVQAWA